MNKIFNKVRSFYGTIAPKAKRYFLLSITFWIFRSPIYKLLQEIVVDPFLIPVDRSIWLSIVLVAIFIFITIVKSLDLYEQVSTKLTGSKKEIDLVNTFICFISLLVVCLHLRFDTNRRWDFEEFSQQYWMKYYDLIFLLIIPFSIQLKRKIVDSLKKSTIPFIEDNHETFSNEDKLKRKIFAQELSNKILNTNSLKKSFAIGITGNWGSGKSIVLKYIQDAIEPHCIVVNFDPWKSQSQNSIVKDFMTLYTYKVSQYNHNLEDKLLNYAESLSDTTESIGKIFSLVRLSLFGQVPIEDQYEDIKEDISKLDKKIVVFIDDLDRLRSNEIIEVLTIVRNTANFPNTFFIVAYDNEYVTKAIANELRDNNGDIEEKGRRYLDKIFQLVSPLPIYKDEFLALELKTLLAKGRENTEAVQLLERIVDSISAAQYYSLEKQQEPKTFNIILSCINNLRDCIKLVNSFNFSLDENRRASLNYHDLLVLEIIKLKFPEAISYLEEFSPSSLPFYKNPSIALTGTEIAKITNKEKGTLAGHMLNYLFLGGSEWNDNNSINNAKNFYAYLTPEMFGRIKSGDFNQLKSKGLKHFYSLSKEYDSDAVKTDLLDIINKVDFFESEEEFKNLLETLLEISTIYPKNSLEVFNNFFKIDALNKIGFFSNLEESKTYLWGVFNDLVVNPSNQVKISIFKSILNKLTFASQDNKAAERLNYELYSEVFRLAYEQRIYNNFIYSLISTNHRPFERIEDVYNTNFWNDKVKEILTTYVNKYFSDIINTYGVEIVRENTVYDLNENGREFFRNIVVLSSLLEDNLENLSIKAFLRKFWRNKREPIPYDFSLLEMEISNLVYKGNTFAKNVDEINEPAKLLFYNIDNLRNNTKFPELKERFWFAGHKSMKEVSKEEASAGTKYKFSFNLPLNLQSSDIKNSFFCFMADDHAEIILNGESLLEKESANLFKSVDKIDTTNILNYSGNNKFTIWVRNKSLEEIRALPNFENHSIDSGEHNEYGIVFYLELVLTNPIEYTKIKIVEGKHHELPDF